MRSIEIIPARIFGPAAFYNPHSNKIYYDEHLDVFPGLKKKIIDHEIAHAEHSKNYLFHTWIDLKDMLLLSFNKDTVEFESTRYECTERKLTITELIQNTPYQIFIQIYSAILTILIFSPRQIFKSIKDALKRGKE